MEVKESNLEKRLFNLASRVQKLVQSLPKTETNRIYGRQIIRSSSSIGANYAKATCALTKKDFTNDINRARKEAKETLYWLTLIAEANQNIRPKIKDLLVEAEEIVKILSKSVKTAKNL